MREYRIIEELRTSEGISGKINIKKDEKFNVFQTEFRSDSKVEMKYAG